MLFYCTYLVNFAVFFILLSCRRRTESVKCSMTCVSMIEDCYISRLLDLICRSSWWGTRLVGWRWFNQDIKKESSANLAHYQRWNEQLWKLYIVNENLYSSFHKACDEMNVNQNSKEYAGNWKVETEYFAEHWYQEWHLFLQCSFIAKFQISWLCWIQREWN